MHATIRKRCKCKCNLSYWCLSHFNECHHVLLTLKVIHTGLLHGLCYHVVVLVLSQTTWSPKPGFVPCLLIPSIHHPPHYFHFDSCASAWWLYQTGLLRRLKQFHQNDHQISYWSGTLSDHRGFFSNLILPYCWVFLILFFNPEMHFALAALEWKAYRPLRKM